MITFQRQHEVLCIIQSKALEGFLDFIRTHESAKDYPDYVAARLDAMRTLATLAEIEACVGEDRARAWLDAALDRARTESAREAAE